MLASVSGTEPGIRREAFGAIAAAYWKPVYKYIRLRWKKSNDEAKDLTQQFFAEMLEGEMIPRFDASRASFRTYVRMCVDGFVANENQAAARLKRGGGMQLVSLDFDGVEREMPAGADAFPMEEFFHREWQRQIFALAIEDLREFAKARGKDLPLRIFEEHDLAEEPESYGELARRYRITETAVTNYLAWARRELRRLALERIAAITSGGREFRQEARSLFGPRR